MLYANFHTHTPFCRHADGDEEAYILTAIERGVAVLGFSDHTPHRFYGGLTSSTRMTPEEMPLYVRRLTELRDKYRDRIEILIGFECECYPTGFEETLALYEGYPIDYIIHGQHSDIAEPDPRAIHFYHPRPDTDDTLHLYFSRLYAAIDSGRYTYLAHPDFLYHQNRALYEGEMRRLLLYAKERAIPVEINLLGMCGGRHYPSPLTLRLLGETGAPAILGCDAHNPDRVAKPEEVAFAMQAVRDYGITLARTLDIVNPLTRARRTIDLHTERLF